MRSFLLLYLFNQQAEAEFVAGNFGDEDINGVGLSLLYGEGGAGGNAAQLAIPVRRFLVLVEGVALLFAGDFALVVPPGAQGHIIA